MADAKEFDWSKVSGRAVQRLRAPKVPPVPTPIVALAQKSWDGVVDDDNPEGEKLHVLRHEFGDKEVAESFAKLIKKAGYHTTPNTTVTVVFDPDDDGHELLVAWRAGAKRGKRAKPAPDAEK